MADITEKVMQASDQVSSLLSIATTKRQTILKQFVNVILLFVVLLVFGCLDFATLTVHLEYLTTASYWGTVASKVIAGVCAFNIGINTMYDAELIKDAVLQELIARYQKLLTYKQQDFEYYVVKVFNPFQKKNAYLSYINKKIYYLNKFSRRKDRLLYSSDIATKEEKMKNRYCVKRQELEDLKSDDYIAKNLDSIIVKYYEIDPAIFELELDGSSKTHGIKTKGSFTVGRTVASSTVIMSMLGFSMLMTTFGLEADKEVFDSQMVKFWHYCLKAVEDVGVVLWQFIQGTLRTRRIISQQITLPLSGRCQVLEAYLEWRIKNKIPDTEVYKELKEEVIEISQEELEKIKDAK